MRILAIDYGSKRIGLALTDPLGLFSQPLDIWENHGLNKFADRVEALVKEKGVQEIVVGHPKNMDGSIGPAANKVEKVSQKLRERINIPIILWDERLTTKEAERFLIEDLNMSRAKRKKTMDKLAASILLNQYLEGRKKT